MKTLTASFLILTFALGAQALTQTQPQAQFQRPEVRILPSPEVSSSDRMSLADVAEVERANPNLIQALEQVSIEADRTYTTGELSFLIKEELKSQPSLREINISYTIPETLKVTKASGLSREHIQRRVAQYGSALEAEAQIQVLIHSLPQISGAPYFIDWSQLAKGSFILPVRETGVFAPKYITGQLKVKRLTPVALRNIPMNERVQPSDFKLDYVDTTFTKESAPRQQDLIGQLAARTLQMGQPIWTSSLRREPAARRGQMVKAIVGSDEIEISLNVVAEDAGFVGDIIKVKSPDTQKIMSAVVIEKGVVKVQ